MTLVKLNETLKRDFDGEKATEEVISIAYNIVDNDIIIGSASISNGYFSVNGKMTGTMEEIRDKVEGLFAAE